MQTSNGALMIDSFRRWVALAEYPEAEGVAAMAAEYRRLARMPRDESLAAMQLLTRLELATEDSDLRLLTRRRLKAWLALHEGDAPVIASLFEEASAGLPATPAMRQVAVVQSVAADFSLSDLTRLRELIPERALGVSTKPLSVTAARPEARSFWALPRSALGRALGVSKPSRHVPYEPG